MDTTEHSDHTTQHVCIYITDTQSTHRVHTHTLHSQELPTSKKLLFRSSDKVILKFHDLLTV